MSRDRGQAPYVSETPMTYGDYAGMPDDGYRYELVNMQLEVLEPGPNTTHQTYLSVLYDTMLRTCEDEYFLLFAPLDVILSEKDVRQPDLIAIHRSRMDIVRKPGIFGVPDLVVEILSPGSIKRDRKGKLETYQQYAVPEYWIADPQMGTLEQYLYRDDGLRLHEVFDAKDLDLVTSPGLPCVSFELSRMLKKVPQFSE